MAYDEPLADRVRKYLTETNWLFEEKKMFSGLCFLVADKMLAGVRAQDLMLRIDPQDFDQALDEPGCKAMTMHGKSVRGFVVVDQAVLQSGKAIASWLQLALKFNPKAKSSKEKKGKRLN